ncbi:MAG TPA: 3-keto-5-aminohexanoate cleavage protein [Methanocellaceae archaeon]
MFVNGELSQKLVIQLAPTGMVPTKADTPNVPITPDEIRDDTYRAYKLGASVVHVHARDGHGDPTYKKEAYAEIFSAIREKCPDIIICASTSGRNDPDISHRAEVLDLRPDMASLTLGSVNFSDGPSINTMHDIIVLANMMNGCGVKPELEIFDSGFINNANYLASKGILKAPMHFNLLFGSLGSIQADFRDLVYLSGSLPAGSTWCAAGVGRYQLQANVAAIMMGGHVRVGLEDTIYYSYPDRNLATNEQLVKRIVRVAEEFDRDIASPSEARAILGLKPAEENT